MVKELIVYPDDRILACGDVRGFDESVGRLLDDIIDTMKHHNLDALSAMQVAHPFNMFVIKKGDEYIEFVNPRILQKKDLFTAEEESSYYPDLRIPVPRYETLKIVYEDRHGNTHYMDITGDRHFAAMFQQMMDFVLGGTILDRVDKATREAALAQLEGKGLVMQGDVCPTFSRKDYFVSFADKVLFFMALSLLTPLFDFKKETVEKIWMFDKIAFPVVLALMAGFFIYAFYESRKYRQCSSCQIGNNIGVVIKRSAAAIILVLAANFLVKPF
jgi:peptide deformylase